MEEVKEQEQQEQQEQQEEKTRDINEVLSIFSKLEKERESKPKTAQVSPEALERQKRYWETITKEKPVQSVNVPRMKEDTYKHIRNHITGMRLEDSNHLTACYYLFAGVQFWEPKFLEIAESFFEERINPKKGVLLIGFAGTGKTHTMNHCRQIFNHWGQYEPLLKMGRMDSCKHISEDALKSKLESIDKYKKPMRAICLDDLGAEKAVSSYGNSIEPLEEVLTELHLNFIRHGMKTFVTSNLSVNEIADRYGMRIFDRMREMFNIVTIPSHVKSLRK